MVERKSSTVRLLTTTEVANRLRLEPGTIENWRYQGKGPRFVRIGRVVRYPEDWLVQWVEEVRHG